MAIEINAGTAQVIVALIGIVVPSINAYVQRKKTDVKEDETQAPTVPSDRPLTRTATSKRTLLDLSLVMLCAAFFSSLLVDSLVISGRPPQVNMEVLLKSLTITLVTTGAILSAWHWGKTEVGVAGTALTTLIVLLISPGGPISSPYNGGVPGISLWLPLAVLIIIICAMVVYLLGNPFARDMLPKTRRITLTAVAALVLIGALATGKQKILDVQNNRKLPHFEGSQEERQTVESLIADIRTTNLPELGRLYRLGSEIALCDYYRGKFLTAGSNSSPENSTSNSTSLSDRNLEIPPDSAHQRRLLALRHNVYEYITGQNADLQRAYLTDRLLWAHPTVLTGNTPLIIDLPGTTTQQRFEETSSLRVENARTKLQGIQSEFAPGDLIDGRSTYRRRVSREQQLDILPPLTQQNYTDILIRQHSLGAADDAYITYAVYWNLAKQLPQNAKFRGSLDAFMALKPATQPIETTPAGQTLPSVHSTGSGASASSPQPTMENGSARNTRPDSSGMPGPASASSQRESGAASDTTAASDIETGSLSAKSDPALPSSTRENDSETSEQIGNHYRQAFLTYVVEPTLQASDTTAGRFDVFNVLLKISEKQPPMPDMGNGLNAALNLANQIEETAPVNPVSENSDNSDADMKALSVWIKSNLAPAERGTLIKLLRNEHTDIPLRYLLDHQVTKFVSQVSKNVPDDDKMVFFGLLENPVTPVISDIADKQLPYKADAALPEHLKKYLRLQKMREPLLLNLALALYQPDGEFAPDLIDLFLFQALSLSATLGYFCAAGLMLPLFLFAVALGVWLGRKMIERDSNRVLIETERTRHESYAVTVGFVTGFLGREGLRERLLKLGGRGWSTIALVGRRGVGKSRVLHELFQAGNRGEMGCGVTVWMATPSSYTEQDFVESTLEQLAYSTENAVAHYLGAEPYAVRRLEAQMTRAGMFAFVLGCSLLASILWIMQLRLRVNPILPAVPIILVIVGSIFCLVKHLATAQPVDLSAWLENDRSSSAHAVLLYRRTREVMGYLRTRRAKDGYMPGGGTFGNRRIWIVSAGVLLACYLPGASIMFLDTLSSRNGSLLSGLILVGGITLLCLLVVMFYNVTGQNKMQERGDSLMALIAEYRLFASTIVYRLQHGALQRNGSKEEHEKARVMICIDELDKIVVQEEIRAFLRRMKGIFEIPGVYYYLSLSEDTYGALYLGQAEGKNEVDSSLDHIVPIQPLTWDDCRKIVEQYLAHQKAMEVEARMIDAVSTISFGVARDVLRRCDELLAREDGLKTGSVSVLNSQNEVKPEPKAREEPPFFTPEQFIREWRNEQVKTAAMIHEWPDEKVKALRGEPQEVCSSLAEQLYAGKEALDEMRILVMIWTLCRIEIAVQAEGAGTRESLKNLFQLGYNVSLRPVPDLIEDMRSFEQTVSETLSASLPMAARWRKTRKAVMGAIPKPKGKQAQSSEKNGHALELSNAASTSLGQSSPLPE